MKESGITHWTSPNTGATNSSGFTGLPGGFRRFSGTFVSINVGGGWWSSTENTATEAPSNNVDNGSSIISPGGNYKSDGFYVRCIKGHYIGESFGGGIIFYVSANGQHGLIAAPSDQSTGVQWGCYGTTNPNAYDTAIGTGNQNTINILSACTTPGIPAKLCSDLVSGGYDDWYLPSKDELSQLYLNKAVVGGLASTIYWSSSDNDIYVAWVENFNTGNVYQGNNNNLNNVRAVRSF